MKSVLIVAVVLALVVSVMMLAHAAYSYYTDPIGGRIHIVRQDLTVCAKCHVDEKLWPVRSARNKP